MIEWGRASGGVTTIEREGTPIATARAAAMRGDMHLEINGARWLFFASRGALVGERSGAEQPSLHATRPGRSRSAWDIEADQVTYHLERTSRMSGRFVVRRDGTDIATGRGRGRRRRATLDTNTDIPLEHQVFALWLIGADHRPGKCIPGGSSADGPVPGSTAYGASGATNMSSGSGFDVGPT